MRNTLFYKKFYYMKTIHDIISGKHPLPWRDNWEEIENFIGTDWRLSYDLHNPENFQDPDDAPSWYDPNDCYDFYETPFYNPQIIEIWGIHTPENLSLMKHIYEHIVEIESSIILYLVNYTFHDGGAYAEWKYFYFAKKTIEKSENRIFQNERDFMKNCLGVRNITLDENGCDWVLQLRCAWDTEHEIELHFHMDSLVSVE